MITITGNAIGICIVNGVVGFFNFGFVLFVLSFFFLSVFCFVWWIPRFLDSLFLQFDLNCVLWSFGCWEKLSLKE